MEDLTYICRKCGNVFKSPVGKYVLLKQGPNCPQCGAGETGELPSWAPVGSDLHNAPDEWEYECQDCLQRFKLPIPQSPSRETMVSCPHCRGTHIHRLTPMGFEPLYCG